ncbi:MAG: 4-alpha-glucanotransferase [Verrucomicrobiota bacterium]
MANQEPFYNWLSERSAGVLLHLSSLPSDFGIGNLGGSAFRFVDFLSRSGLKIWQLCPLGPTGYGDSPYQCFSAFAGNPYFVDLQPLLDGGLLNVSEIEPLRALPHDRVDYGALYHAFWPVLEKAYDRFKASGAKEFLDYGDFAKFKKSQANWLSDYTLFIALKDYFDGRCWLDWPKEFRDYMLVEKPKLKRSVTNKANFHAFIQYLFFAQLKKLRAYAGTKGVEIMGDIPIFVALDSADVWANTDLFELKPNMKPKAVAGVPPDYFSEDGQLWGNPLFKWKVHHATGFKWWLRRLGSNLKFFDIVRLDHFRGFESYWSVPANAKTARGGKWIKAPGLEFFEAASKKFPNAKIVAEDLGVITDEVNELLQATGLPGMAVLHFAFGGSEKNAYLPHNHKPNSVVYPGTHDNNTSKAWYASLDELTKDHVRRTLSVPGDAIEWDLIRAAYASVARMAIFPLQDLMSLGGEARLNTPGAAKGNWQWRYHPEQLDALEGQSSSYLRELAGYHNR